MNNINKQKISLLCTMNELAEAITQKQALAAESYTDMRDAMLAVGVHPNSHMLELLDSLVQGEDVGDEFAILFNKFYDAQIIAANSSLIISESFEDKRLGCDRLFYDLVSIIKRSSIEALIRVATDSLATLQKENEPMYKQLTVGYVGWYFEDLQLDGIGGENNSLLISRMTVLKENIDKICKVYNMLADNLSRVTMNAIIKNWLTFDSIDVQKCSTYLREAVDVDVFPIYDDEVFVDCGSYIGDTVAEYCNQANKKYKRIYTYDISHNTVEVMKKNLAQLDNIIYNVKGVGEHSDTLELSGVDNPFAGNKLVKGNSNTSIKVPVVKLDEDILEPITFLKIDVEGLDKQAILGARQQIEQNHPKLAIDSYHHLVDFFEVPLLIKQIDPSYNIFLRIAAEFENPLYFPRPSVYAV